MKDLIQKIKSGGNLTQTEIEQAMHALMSGKAERQDIADFLLALKAKGPTIEEITGAANIMREYVVKIKTQHQKVLDTCGTGGDKCGTFNISTATAFVVAGAGGIVAKHGNRSVSSKCGSACLLEALGVDLGIEDEFISECLDDVGIAFLYAQKLHPAMRNVAPVRKELGVETIFNILGPLTNPAKATHQIMGVYSRELVEPLTHVLKNLGLQRAMVVHGIDGLDEITTTGKTFICEYNGQDILSYDIEPEELGFKRASLEELKGGDLQENVKIFNQILDGVAGPQRDIVLLNAAYALYVLGKVENISSGIDLAKDSIDSGKARHKFEQLVEFTNRIKRVNKGYDEKNEVKE